MKKIVLMLLFVLALTPAAVSAQSLNGSIYAAQGASVPVLFNFSVSGETFIVTILTFGAGATAAGSPRPAPRTR